jgi:methionine-rich copper-binding protein CopC
MMRKSLVLVASIAVLCLLVRAAGAHAHLERAQPTAGSKNAEVHEIRLFFSEPLEPKLSTIRLEDREDRVVVEPTAQPDPADGKILVLRLFEPLVPGEYKVSWAVVAADGHRMSGSYSFLVSR